ncbi:hypothetical protein PTMSG1_05024 [Pyrenophora teres f. maculata]|nr:hypothetical protein PTMSG1_05024 [Pyrenophora teres f. maculata]
MADLVDLFYHATRLQLEPSSHAEDENDEAYRDAKSKYDLARLEQLEVLDPEKRWQRLKRDTQALRDEVVQVAAICTAVEEETTRKLSREHTLSGLIRLPTNTHSEKTEELVRAANAKHENCDNTIAGLGNRIRQLEDDVQEWETNHTECSDQESTLKSLTELLRQQRDHQDDRSIVESLRQHLSQHENCSTTLDQVQQQLQGLRKESLAQQGTIKRLQKESLAQQGTVKGLQKESLAQQGTVQRLQKESLAHQGTVQRLQKESLAQQGTVQRLQKESLAHQGTVQRLQKERLAQQGTVEGPQKESLAHKGIVEGLQKESLAHKGTVQELQNENLRLKALIEQTTVSTTHAQRPVEPESSPLEELRKVDKDLSHLFTHIKLIVDGFSRTDPDVNAKYESMLKSIATWTRHDIRRFIDSPNQSASLTELVRETLINYDILYKSYASLLEKLQLQVGNMKEIEGTMAELARYGHEWKEDCLALMEKIKGERATAAARQSDHLKKLEAKDKVIVELQAMLNSILDEDEAGTSDI